MGFFSGLEDEAYDRQYSDRDLIARMARYFRPHARKLVVISLMLIILAITGAALPVIVAQGVNLLSSNPSNSIIVILFLAVLLTGILNWLANWVRRRLTQQALR